MNGLSNNTSLQTASPSKKADSIYKLKEGSKVLLLAPIKLKKTNKKEQLDLLIQQGFTRIWLNDKIEKIVNVDVKQLTDNQVDLLIDRFIVDYNDKDNDSRIYDSIENAVYIRSNEMRNRFTK